MTTLTLPPIEVLADAAAVLAAAAHDAGDTRNENALNNAIFDMQMGSFPIATSGGFLVKSSTRNMVHRVSNLYGCNCEAGRKGQPCRHAAQIEIIEAAQIHYTAPAVDRIAKGRAAADAFNAEIFA